MRFPVTELQISIIKSLQQILCVSVSFLAVSSMGGETYTDLGLNKYIPSKHFTWSRYALMSQVLADSQRLQAMWRNREITKRLTEESKQRAQFMRPFTCLFLFIELCFYAFSHCVQLTVSCNSSWCHQTHLAHETLKENKVKKSHLLVFGS